MIGYWKDAPDWAEWIAWDYCGWANYYKAEPIWRYDEFLCGRRSTMIVRCSRYDDANKAGQLEKRLKVSRNT
jgi:hypothetical protein